MKTSLRKDRKDRERTVRNLNIFFTQSFQCHIHFYEETDLEDLYEYRTPQTQKITLLQKIKLRAK